MFRVYVGFRAKGLGFTIQALGLADRHPSEVDKGSSKIMFSRTGMPLRCP